MRSLKRASCLALLAAAVTAGCGPYTMKDQYRSGVKTVFVPTWTRGQKVYRRDLEQDLTEAIQKSIEQYTPYKVTSKDRADTELRGRIVRIEQRVLTKNPDTGRPRELEQTFVVAFTWKDLRTGKILEERSELRVAGTYIPHRPFREDFFHGSQDVINRLARRIVETMEAEW